MFCLESVRLPGSPGPKQVLLRDGNELLDPLFWCFFGCLDFLVFSFFFDSFFIDFWTPSSLRCAAPAMLFSCFSCFEKVIILDDFWPPKTSPTPQLFVFFDHLFFHVFVCFRFSHFSKTSLIVLPNSDSHAQKECQTKCFFLFERSQSEIKSPITSSSETCLTNGYVALAAPLVPLVGRCSTVLWVINLTS